MEDIVCRNLLNATCFFVLIGFSNGMTVENSSFYTCIDRQLDGVTQLFESISRLPCYANEKSDIFAVRSLVNRLQNRLLYIKNNKSGCMTPEEAGNIVRRLNGGELFNESSPDALIESFKKIKDLLLENNTDISNDERTALIIVLECYANASPGELTYPFSDEDQISIIDAANDVYS